MTQAPGFYAVASVIKDVYKTEQMTMLAKNQTLSQQVVEYFDQTVVELGIGMQRVLEGYSSIYADIRYEDGFHSRENTWKLNLGLRF
jgi:capsid portal protein